MHLPYQAILQDVAGSYANPVAYRAALYRQSLRNEAVLKSQSGDRVPSYVTPIYLRLVDGSLADKLSLTALRRMLLADLSRPVRRLVIIAVSAHSDPRSDLDVSTQSTTILTAANAVSGSLVDNATANAASVFQDFITQLTYDRDQMVRNGQPNARFRGLSNHDRLRPVADGDGPRAAEVGDGKVDRHELDAEAG